MPEASVAVQPHVDSAVLDAMATWATSRGFAFSRLGDGNAFSLTGSLASKPWKLECGHSTRNYIRGDELRARGEIRVNDDASVLIMNRPLKDALEKLAYQMYTDTLQTTADPSLPEEMRWLAMYPEVGWENLSSAFWARHAVMADKREHALAWLDQELAGLLMNWPEQKPGADVPFILMLLRGKAYLRMQYTPADLPTLEHATRIFERACENAMARLSTDLVL
ncbi:MAG: hypothetical protein Q7T70_05835 [Polaromonas sp.]|nr:hypothetical protein [Polaromonas sp.]